MRSTKIWTISLPPAMEREATYLARVEHRTKSELVREALRTYLTTRQWAAAQQLAAKRAQQHGIRTDADIERAIDDLRR